MDGISDCVHAGDIPTRTVTYDDRCPLNFCVITRQYRARSRSIRTDCYLGCSERAFHAYCHIADVAGQAGITDCSSSLTSENLVRFRLIRTSPRRTVYCLPHLLQEAVNLPQFVSPHQSPVPNQIHTSQSVWQPSCDYEGFHARRGAQQPPNQGAWLQ